VYRWVPGFKMLWDRRSRLYDKFNLYVLPGTSLFFYQFADIAFGFKLFTVLPLVLLYIRIRDKTKEPNMKETYLRDIMYKTPEIT